VRTRGQAPRADCDFDHERSWGTDGTVDEGTEQMRLMAVQTVTGYELGPWLN
jgi:hypothetical protein